MGLNNPVAVGNVPAAATDAGNPVKIGGVVGQAFPTELITGKRANQLVDRFGRSLTSHIDPAMQIWKPARYTTTQTGAVVWAPTTGKRIAVTHVIMGSGATTPGRLILWFGANGDTVYSAGTDQLIADITFTPSASATPAGAPPMDTTPIFCQTADFELHATTDAALTIGFVVYGYHW